MARRGRLSKFSVAKMTSTPAGAAPAAAEPQQEERGVLFGSRQDRKNIIIMSCIGFVLVAVGFYVVARDQSPSPLAIIFAGVHGALIGMLLGQLILVYPDRVIVILTIVTAMLGEVLYMLGTGKFQNFQFTVDVFQAMTAIFFWAGFIGFWIGFWAYAKRMKRLERFRQRVQAQQQAGQ